MPLKRSSGDTYARNIYNTSNEAQVYQRYYLLLTKRVPIENSAHKVTKRNCYGKEHEEGGHLIMAF
jgi:hypothetical protein